MSLSESAKRETVVAAAEECFHVQGFILQYCEPDFGEWVDLEDDYTPVDKEKVQVLLRNVPGALFTAEEVGKSQSLNPLSPN